MKSPHAESATAPDGTAGPEAALEAAGTPDFALRRISEKAFPGVEVPLLHHPEWAREYPWLVQGITHRGDPDGADFDLGIGGRAPVADVLGRWERVRQALGMRGVVISRQVHGATVRLARAPLVGVHLTLPADGHLTADPDLLLAVSVADCVPVFLVEPRSRTLALLHAGWRGVAAGVVEEGVRSLQDRFGVEPSSLLAHLGPAISGARYPVGPEVPVALDLPDPGSTIHLDLTPHIAERLVRQGVTPEAITASSYCVHDHPAFFSHRGGDGGRQMALLGFRGRPGER